MRNIVVSVLLLFGYQISTAQLATTNTGNLQIHSGASVTVVGNFTNSSSAGLVNQGNFYAKANITNDQTSMSSGTGTLHLNGASGLQNINGTQPFKTYNLVTANSAGIQLNNNLSVSGAHTFTSGIITTSATPNYLIYESGSSYSGSNDTKHVNGWIKKLGSTDFTFPVGNENFERPVSITQLSSNSEFNVKYYLSTPYANQLQTPIVSMNANEYWAVDRVSGTSASVSMNWDNSKVTFPDWYNQEITTANYNGSVWTNQGGTASGNAATTGTITSDNISAFNLFSLASRSFPVPLTLINFQAKRIHDQTEIRWTTTNEQGVDHFEVQRSDNAYSFTTIAQTNARNLGNLENYIAFDKKPIEGKAHYRLKMIDRDGDVKFSSIVTITVSSLRNELSLLTNPVQEKIVLLANIHSAGIFDYTVSSMNGQLMQQGKIFMQAGQNNIRLNNLAPSIYLLKIINEKYNASFKFEVK